MPKPSRTYEMVVRYRTQKTLPIKARSRQEAIEKAGKRCEKLGIDDRAGGALPRG
ncbi:hypothetical protein LV780_21825 (plasmid) [Cereibacter azotoformans]|uniref:Integrase n=1 Tax=Cereibacter azotoformans TaxID=43057 RepID=A0A2T5JPY2_9RHOB|nr:hypothetical protein [Cereibacter azotoformans]MBO4170785.1 hypothetical protein [Cereibacter azotoformans]PTR09897.1 hypothetical protein C8J28_1318 [Cereibacter azotoformans]UIJ33291.1 hypothetical protein LV780_21825 [Cereibacter azotoformans]